MYISLYRVMFTIAIRETRYTIVSTQQNYIFDFVFWCCIKSIGRLFPVLDLIFTTSIQDRRQTEDRLKEWRKKDQRGSSHH